MTTVTRAGRAGGRKAAADAVPTTAAPVPTRQSSRSTKGVKKEPEDYVTTPAASKTSSGNQQQQKQAIQSEHEEPQQEEEEEVEEINLHEDLSDHDQQAVEAVATIAQLSHGYSKKARLGGDIQLEAQNSDGEQVTIEFHPQTGDLTVNNADPMAESMGEEEIISSVTAIQDDGEMEVMVEHDQEVAVSLASGDFSPHQAAVQYHIKDQNGQLIRVVNMNEQSETAPYLVMLPEVTSGSRRKQSGGRRQTSIPSAMPVTIGPDGTIRASAPRDERRRVNHNEVERRRRDKINHLIQRIAQFVPSADAESIKGPVAKGNILQKAVDHIIYLQNENSRLQEVEAAYDDLAAKTDGSNLDKDEIGRLQALLTKNNIPF